MRCSTVASSVTVILVFTLLGSFLLTHFCWVKVLGIRGCIKLEFDPWTSYRFNLLMMNHPSIYSVDLPTSLHRFHAKIVHFKNILSTDLIKTMFCWYTYLNFLSLFKFIGTISTPAGCAARHLLVLFFFRDSLSSGLVLPEHISATQMFAFKDTWTCWSTLFS